MDLLGEQPISSLDDEKWRMFTRHGARSPQFVGEGAIVKNSIVSEGCKIYGRVENSVLFGNVTVLPGAVVRDSVVLNDCRIGAGANVSYAILDSGVSVGAGVTLGGDRSGAPDVTVIGAETVIADGEKIEAGSMIPDVR